MTHPLRAPSRRPILAVRRTLFDGKVLLITGGTGSFGQAFVKHLLACHNPAKIIVFSRDELKQHEMSQRYKSEKMRYFIGNVRDSDRLQVALDGVDIVVHAAALKQVPACEYNPFEAVKTNIIGTQNVIQAALDANVSKVIAISSDKAVNPVNLYGATKMVLERLFVHSNVYAGDKRKTIFSVVRYGNVLGSRGSVVPLFLKQRKHGKITITDVRMTRFWMTLNFACRLVVDALEQMVGGEIVVPADLHAMSIVDLARVVAPDAYVTITGIRPGEKLHECLISAYEAPRTYRRDDLYIVAPGAEGNGIKVPVDFEYTSEHAPRLTAERIAKMIWDWEESR